MTDDELRRLFEGHSAEIRRHFDVSTEAMKREVRILAEAVAHLDEKLDRTGAGIRSEMRDGFEETHGLIRNLGRRLHVVEERYKL